MVPTDDIQQLPLFDPKQTIADVITRYEGLAANGRNLPDSLTVPEDYHIQYTLEHMPKDFLTEPWTNRHGEEISRPRDIDTKAFTMSLFGWSAHESDPEVAVCGACFRRVGLWIYRADHAKGKEAVISHLDVLEEHREFCPWRNAKSQAMKPGLYGISGKTDENSPPGWLFLEHAIFNAHHLRHELNVVRTSLPASPGTARFFPHTSPTAGSSQAGPSSSPPRNTESSAGSVVEPAEVENALEATPESKAAQEEAKDRVRWAKLKQLRRALHLGGKKKFDKGKGPQK
jgi:hypothetical protein